MLAEFGVNGGGVDLVFEQFVDDAVRLDGGGGEDEDLFQIPVLDQVAEQGALLFLGDQISELVDQIDFVRFIGDLDDLRISQNHLLDPAQVIAERGGE